MAISIPSLVLGLSAGLAVGGAVAGIEALSSSPKSPSQATLPSETAAANTAQAAQTQSRQAALAAGGSTNVTGGSGIILGSEVTSLSLVGSS